MKKFKIKYILFMGVISLLSFSCKKSLDMIPLDQLSDASYWTAPNDFKLASNQFYTYLRNWNNIIFNNSSSYHSDWTSDIMGGANTLSRGLNTIPTSDGFYNTSYTRIRAINYLLAKATTYATPADIAKYVAEAQFFRAYIYFDLLQTYGAVPLITTPLVPTSPELFKPRTSRDSIADFIISDLNAAITVLPLENTIAAADKGRVSKGTAQAFLSRVALYEGTWQEFRNNTTRANALLDIAISSSGAVISSAQYTLFGTTTATTALGDSAQKYMFILDNGKSNPANIQKSANNEYIFANRYDQNLRQTRINIAHSVNGAELNRNFVNMYLCKDGLPVEKSSLFQGYTTMISEFQNRDNRLRFNIKIAGNYYWSGNANWRVDWVGGLPDKANADGSPFKPYLNGISGYHSQKWVNEQQCQDYAESYDYPVIRYAEVLLNYAEAVFERNGSITDADLNKSLNLVRLRVNKSNSMPALSNAFVTVNGLDMRTEIRRERTVEFYLEGFRTDDLKRWHDLTSWTKPILGIQWTGTQFATTWASQSGTAKDANGCLIVDNSRSFTEKNFLLPIPSQQIQLNPQLTQNPGW